MKKPNWHKLFLVQYSAQTTWTIIQGPPAGVKEAIDEMTSFVYKQTKDILSSHFPRFPNPFAEESPYKIPFPQLDVRKYNRREQIYDD